MIYATLVNTQTHRQTDRQSLTDYTISSAAELKNSLLSNSCLPDKNL